MSKKDSESKPSKQKETEFPNPGQEDRKVFLAALEIAKNLFDEGKLKIDIDQRGMIGIDVANKTIEDLPKEKLNEGLTHKHLEALISTELESLAQAATYPDTIKGLQFSIPSNILEKVGPEEFLWRLNETKRLLLSEEIFERALFRRTSNTFFLDNITWQIISKKYDAEAGKLPDIKGVVLKITYNRTEVAGSLRISGKDFSLDLPTIMEPKDLTLELHKKDVHKMIESLEEAKKRLENGGK